MLEEIVGGMQIDSIESTAIGLAANTMRKIAIGESQCFMYEFYRDRIREETMVDTNEFLGHAGFHNWKALEEKVRKASPFLSFIAYSMASIHELNEKSENRIISPIAGSSSVSHEHRITVAESITLIHYGISTCASLFKKSEITSNLDVSQDIVYAGDLIARHGILVSKCKKLRASLASKQVHRTNTQIALVRLIVDTKPSQLYRKMKRKHINDSIKAPPSYHTRRRDKYAVPPLDKYMQGYTRLISMNIPSKTKEISNNILNRQSWTNPKQNWVNRNRGLDMDGDGTSDDTCKLCGKIETTQHIILECEEYSEGLWESLEKAFAKVFQENIRLHCFNIMYNQPVGRVPSKFLDVVDAIIQESKRFILHKRYMRETNPNLANIIYNERRIHAHIIIITNKVKSLRKYQGLGNNEIFEQLNSFLNERV